MLCNKLFNFIYLFVFIYLLVNLLTTTLDRFFTTPSGGISGGSCYPVYEYDNE